MFRIILSVLIIIHAFIHLMGVAKAFGYGEIQGLSKPVSKTKGFLWLLAMLLLVAGGLLYMGNMNAWWIIAASGAMLSQYLIFTAWKDAKYGTLLNLFIVLAAIAGWSSTGFYHEYREQVSAFIDQGIAHKNLLSEQDISDLPVPVKKYLRYTGSLGKPKIENFRVVFSGRIRKDESSAWMPFTSEQYNFMDAAARLFFMKATMMHLPVAGYHCFLNGHAFMDIRLFSLFKVQYQSGNEMDTAETVTFFNDMCCMAPATLIDKRIKWMETDSNTVSASFTNNGITVSATLYFNERGELVNFVSGDRYATTGKNTMEKLRWSTPLKDYKEVNGYRLAGYADAVYTYPSGDFCYGQFYTKNV